MTQEQWNSKAALDEVVTQFTAHPAHWSGIVPITESVAALLHVQREIRLSAMIQADGTSGNTAALRLAFELSAEKAYSMSRRICAWARKHGKAAILASVDFSISSLTQGAREGALNRQRLVLHYAEENRVELAAYKVNDTSIDDLKAAIQTVEVLVAGRNQKSNKRVYSTGRLEELFTKARGILAILDDEVEGLIEDGGFVETYFIARRITDRKAGRSSAAPAEG